jgi:hypothetical protein
MDQENARKVKSRFIKKRPFTTKGFFIDIVFDNKPRMRKEATFGIINYPTVAQYY